MIKKKKKKLSKEAWMAIFVAFIMTFSIVGFLFGGSGDVSSRADYNGYTLEKVGNLWVTKIEGKGVVFRSFPTDVENIKVNGAVFDKILGTKMVYLTFDPEQEDLNYVELARFELKKEFPDYFGIYAVDAVTKSNSTYNLAVIDCENATDYVPVIKFQQSNSTFIDYRSNCIKINSDGFDFLRAKDRLLYGMFGIIS